MGSFINYTNHPSTRWGQRQVSAAREYGDIVDMPFYDVPSETTTEEIRRLAIQEADRILARNPAAVLCQGEFTLVYNIIVILKRENIKVVAACSERLVEEVQEADGSITRKSNFVFRGFREY